MATPSAAQIGGRTVFDRDVLLDFGVQRPADLFDLLPRWSSWSIDGFSNHVSASGHSNYSDERWTLFLDGRRIERGLLGLLDLNMLPVSVHQIDSIEVFSIPTTIAGQWTGEGAIHIHTIRDADGIDLGGSLYTGNEVNDPGPFLYTEYRTPNIDRVGPDGNAYLHLASNGFYASASALYREHHSTDEGIDYRTRHRHDNNNHSPRKLLFTPLLRFGYVGVRTDIDAVLTQTIYNDFAFIPMFGTELPMRQTYTSLSTQGYFTLADNLRFMVGVTATEDFNHGRENLIAWDPDIKADAVRARAGLSVTSRAWSLEFGGGADLFRARPYRDILISDQYHIYRGYFNANHSSSEVQSRIAAEVAQVAGTILPKLYAHFRKSSVTLNASISRNSIFEQHSLWYWISMGYNGFLSLAPSPDGFEHIDANAKATADAEVTLVSSRTAKLSIHAGLRYSHNDWAALSAYTYLPDEVRLENQLRLVSDLGGLVTLAGLGGSVQTDSGFEHEIYGGIQSSVQGGETYRAVNREIPKLRAYYGVRYIGVPGFTLAGRLNVHSSTEWGSFYATSRDDTPFFDGPVIPKHIGLNLYARKSIINKRAWAALKFENVLNRSHRDWPAGEFRNMTFHISLGASLKGRSSSRYSDDPFERPLY